MNNIPPVMHIGIFPAGLSQPVWDELQELAVESCGERILMYTGLGSTETGPAALFPYWEEDRAGHVGLPAPGVELKLVKAGEKTEARLRSPSITPGYWREAELTSAAFDQEGFYCLGDALKFVDPDDPGKGFIFDGRIAEEDIDTTLTAGRPNVWKFYLEGQLSRIRRNTHCPSGKPDVWQIYYKNHMERIGNDATCDGHIDRWDRDAILMAQEEGVQIEDAGARTDGGASDGAPPPSTGYDEGIAATLNDAGAKAKNKRRTGP